jgi:hypothetical protein
MIKVENIEVFNFEGAFRGMRNAYESHERADSIFGVCKMRDRNFSEYFHAAQTAWEGKENKVDLLADGIVKTDKFTDICEVAFIGPRDLRLAKDLIKSGSDHSKFLRQIFVSMDITAPLYFWKQLDTYKVGTVANSESTMHKLKDTPITLDHFSIDIDSEINSIEEVNQILNKAESLRQKFKETKDRRYWRYLIQILPDGWNQKRTWTASYAVIHNMLKGRKNHPVVEWEELCNVFSTMPYVKTFFEEEFNK